MGKGAEGQRGRGAEEILARSQNWPRAGLCYYWRKVRGGRIAYFKKTDRIYGELTEAILNRRGTFTPLDFLPRYTRLQARMRCEHLRAEGRLKCLREAKLGPNQPPAIYEVIPNMKHEICR